MVYFSFYILIPVVNFKVWVCASPRTSQTLLLQWDVSSTMYIACENYSSSGMCEFVFVHCLWNFNKIEGLQKQNAVRHLYSSLTVTWLSHCLKLVMLRWSADLRHEECFPNPSCESEVLLILYRFVRGIWSAVTWFLAEWGLNSYFSLSSYIFFMKFVQIMTYLFILIIEDSVFIRMRENLLRWCESFYCVKPQSCWGEFCCSFYTGMGDVTRTHFTCVLLQWTDKCTICGKVSWYIAIGFIVGAYYTIWHSHSGYGPSLCEVMTIKNIYVAQLVSFKWNYNSECT